VAEDNQDVRLILSRAFKRTHPLITPVFFQDGSELVKHFLANRSSPKLLLLDLQMPVMDGIDALRALKTEGCCGTTPVVIFSSLENPNTIRAAYFWGAKLYLKKPDRLDDYDQVAEFCARCADSLRILPPSAIPFGALDINRVLKLLAPCGATVRR
jgi:CheY-like chemotaxis protein